MDFTSEINNEELRKNLKENILKRLFEDGDGLVISDDQLQQVAEEEIKKCLENIDNYMMNKVRNQIKINEEKKMNQRIIESKIAALTDYLD